MPCLVSARASVFRDRLQAGGFRVQVSGFRLQRQTAGRRFRASGFRCVTRIGPSSQGQRLPMRSRALTTTFRFKSKSKYKSRGEYWKSWISDDKNEGMHQQSTGPMPSPQVHRESRYLFLGKSRAGNGVVWFRCVFRFPQQGSTLTRATPRAIDTGVPAGPRSRTARNSGR